MKIFDCPEDVVAGEQLELHETQLLPPGNEFIVETTGKDYMGNIWVKLGSGLASINRKYTKWRRVVDLAVPTVRPSGARCTGKHCGEYFEYADPRPNFLCYSCRNR